jgi:transcriptional antiterminator RfaH
MSSWCVVHSHAHSEAKACTHLQRQGFEVYYPKFLRRRSHARKVDWAPAPLFPRYLFVQIDFEKSRWLSIYSTTGVANLICFGGRPQSLPSEIVAELRACENDNGYVNLHKRRTVEIGESVRILHGSFTDHIAMLEGLDDKGRVTLLLQFMGQSVRMKTSLNNLVVAE